MNGKWMAVVVMCVAPVFLATPAHSALQSGAVLTVDQGGGDCTWSELLSSYNCTNLGFLPHLEGSIKPVPVPAAIWLFGSGPIGFMGLAWRKHRVA